MDGGKTLSTVRMTRRQTWVQRSHHLRQAGKGHGQERNKGELHCANLYLCPGETLRKGTYDGS